MRWHADDHALARVVGDLVRDEVGALRPGLPALSAGPWAPTLRLDEDGLGLDSLERLSVAGALTEALHLHESGLEDLLLAQQDVGGWLQLVRRALAVADAQLSFRTSGSTGPRKPCTHRLADLQQEVAHTAGLLGAVNRVVSAVPSHHIYGFLFTVLLPQALGGVPVVDGRALTPQGFAKTLRPGDLVVSHPAHWALLSRHGAAFAAGVVGVSSTAPCPDALATSLLEQGLSRLLQVYGSSETAGIGWRDAPGAPFRLMPFWSPGADGGSLHRRHADGGTSPVALQDRLHWTAVDRFELRGRHDAAVQVAGHNVFPEQVRAVLCRHPEVADAAVRLMTPEEGGRLKAFVVPSAGAQPDGLAERLLRWAAAHLPAPAQPRACRIGTALPVNAQGKACDWPVAAEPVV
ncbi:4-coumarate--CoA ligase [Aquabacterium sp. J223]|uniref:4-coumarate--CoA ligase n=1 Tax=Aquabacterium sp. J223 TaxID=2898431 RepID=UPI0021AE1EAB|nr:4-coumarate--CoA ligase [Aquabacterium sp. J223]UUX94477.1 4-coumarate--CoA ligase [Aquabacterium sp. J223]